MREKSSKDKYSLETERKEKENILFQQNATKWITRKESIGTFTKWGSKIRGIIFITDLKSTLKNNYELF